jgi:hypothetical protein
MPRFCCGMEAAPENSKLVIRAVIYDFSAFDLLMSTSWDGCHTADEDFGAGSLSVKDTYLSSFFFSFFFFFLMANEVTALQ